ncbi:MAG TPA: Na+/H+ antiporter subunit E [Xanthobacteraceae bacterium]|nr:Na+/H+ antiporter subunit E [Xanthobacteraceae bacterium]
MRDYIDTARHAIGGSLARAIFFFIFWVILYGVKPADLLVGVLAAIVATWASLRLLPPGRVRLRPIALVQLVLRFPLQSIVAGIDVARRALDPRMSLRPGFVLYRPRLPSGPIRNAFCTMVGLLPGTLPSGSDEKGDLVIHCLDVSQPVAEQLATEEALLRQVLEGAPDG